MPAVYCLFETSLICTVLSQAMKCIYLERKRTQLMFP